MSHMVAYASFFFYHPFGEQLLLPDIFTSLLSTHNIIMTIAYTLSKSCAKSCNL